MRVVAYGLRARVPLPDPLVVCLPPELVDDVLHVVEVLQHHYERVRVVGP